jgi:hypothetical protein
MAKLCEQFVVEALGREGCPGPAASSAGLCLPFVLPGRPDLFGFDNRLPKPCGPSGGLSVRRSPVRGRGVGSGLNAEVTGICGDQLRQAFALSL